jgi:hypothetical protein
MSRITMTALKALSCAVAIAFAAPYAASAAAPVAPIAPAPKPPPPKPPPPGSNPYLAPPQTDATSAYQFRTRILFSPPSCQDFAGQADRVFYNGTLDDKAKAEQLTAVGNAAAAAGCLGR